MAATTFKEVMNKVMIRLREDEVDDVSEGPYPKLIGALINKVKREVEDAWDWQALRTTYQVDTGDGIYNYTLVGSSTRFRVDDVWNTTDDIEMEFMPSVDMDRLFREAYLTGSPRYYSWNGVSADGDVQVDLYPVPDGVYEVEFQLITPQEDLVLNDDVMYVPKEPVIEGVLAHAITERGEDGGQGAALQWQFYKGTLSDAISIEANHFPDEMTWVLR